MRTAWRSGPQHCGVSVFLRCSFYSYRIGFWGEFPIGLPLTCGVNPRHFHRLDSQGRCWIDFPDFQDWTSRWGFWTLRLDFWTSRLDFLDFRVSQERFWKHFRRPKYVQIQTFAENVFFSKSAQNTAPASKIKVLAFQKGTEIQTYVEKIN